MARGGTAGGYTIVETMVFFAVTGLLFASALGLIRGRQAQVQFNQSTRDAQSKIQDIVSQVSTGYFPHDNGFTCSAASGSLAPPVLNVNTDDKQGTSNTCVFLGKVLQFGVGDDDDGVNVFSVASRRYDAAGDEVGDLDEAVPRAIAPASLSAVGTVPDMTETFAFQYGLKVTRVTIPFDDAGNHSSTLDYGAVGFFGSFPKDATSGPSAPASGAQQTNFAAITGITMTATKEEAAAAINAIDTSNTHPSPDPFVRRGIIICLEDPGRRRAKLTIGGAVSGTSVKLDIGDFNTCTQP